MSWDGRRTSLGDEHQGSHHKGRGLRLCFRKISGSSKESGLEQPDCKGAVAEPAGERCSVPQGSRVVEGEVGHLTPETL